MAKILVFAGSARRDSLNKKLARVGAEAVRAAGGEATFVDLDDYPIPVYHGDLEAKEGMPQNARKLRALFLAHEGLLIASPENNQSITSLLKNTIDWLSRVPQQPFSGKPVAMVGASMSLLGAARAQYHLRQTFVFLNINDVKQPEVLIREATGKFDAQGNLTDDTTKKLIGQLLENLVAQSKRK